MFICLSHLVLFQPTVSVMFKHVGGFHADRAGSPGASVRQQMSFAAGLQIICGLQCSRNSVEGGAGGFRHGEHVLVVEK